ncbi:MAG: uncharacterized protein PWQ35_268 [Patescibacteria group bacterium]|nr:uncharacterized protein [Patescibacteria group bacterium]
MYIYLLSPIVAFLIAQGLKIILRATGQKITWHDIFSYSDMPSGHTSIVVAITTIIALEYGISSPLFAISFVFATIVIADAIGLRNYLGLHGKTINILVKDLDEDDFLDNKYPKQLEKIGHTPAQVIVGGIIGALTSLGFFLFY